jgi:protein SCO1
MRAVRLLVVAGVWALLSVPAARAQMTGAPTAGYKREPGIASTAVPPALRSIGFEQRLDQPIPLDVPLRDESGRHIRLRDYFGARPVVLVFAYYDCPMLCTQVINGLSMALNVLSLEPGKDFEIVTVSFNPHDTPETARAKKAVYIERYKHPGASAAWHFLTGDQPAIDRLTQAAGFKYAWDADTRQYAHPTGVIVLTPDGRLARYLFGIEYGPRDLRYALVDASAGKVGNAVDTLLLYCYHYDPLTGRYGLAIMRAVRIAAAATLVALGGFIVLMVRREKSTMSHSPSAASHLPSAASHLPSAASHLPSAPSHPPSAVSHP